MALEKYLLLCDNKGTLNKYGLKIKFEFETVSL